MTITNNQKCFKMAYKKNPELCKTKYCRNKRAKQRRVCHKCRSRKYRSKPKNEMVFTYHCLKQSAKNRGIEFKLTKEEFKSFCEKTNYIELKGRSKNSMSVDRINPKKGYEIDNIQMITVSENVKKMHLDKVKFASWESKNEIFDDFMINVDDLPF